MNEAYLAIAGRIRQELQELAWVVERTTQMWQRAATSPDDYYSEETEEP